MLGIQYTIYSIQYTYTVQNLEILVETFVFLWEARTRPLLWMYFIAADGISGISRQGGSNGQRKPTARCPAGEHLYATYSCMLLHACSRCASSDILYRRTHIHTGCTYKGISAPGKETRRPENIYMLPLHACPPCANVHLQIYFIGGLVSWNLQTGFLKEPTPSTMIHRARHKMHRNGEKSLLSTTNLMSNPAE